MKIYSPSNAVRVAAIAMTLGACSSDKQTRAAVRAPVSERTIGVANMQPATQLPDTSTASNVWLSSDIVRACKIEDRNAYFAFDASNLASVDHGPLDDVAICFTRGIMSGRKLALVGHADPRGAPEYNMALGQARAQAVADYLVSQGVSPANVPSTSRGAMDATGRDERGWARDRRVDVLLGK
jgi:peptidoglycan-associated lipoprotein